MTGKMRGGIGNGRAGIINGYFHNHFNELIKNFCNFTLIVVVLLIFASIKAGHYIVIVIFNIPIKYPPSFHIVPPPSILLQGLK